jgi:hypothetical protein
LALSPQEVDPVEAERLALQELIEQSQQRLQQLTSPTAVTNAVTQTQRVRELVSMGQVEDAAALLGRLPCLQGIIVHGEKRGRTIGYPTANLGDWDMNDIDTVPADGIYAGWLFVDELQAPDSSEGASKEDVKSSHSHSNGDSTPMIPIKGNHGFRCSDDSDGNSDSVIGNDNGFKKDIHAIQQRKYSVRLPAAISIGTNPTFEGQRSRQVEAFATPKDAVIGISTSGNSKNVISALSLARKIGAKTIGFMGNDGGEMKNFVDVGIIVPSNDTARIQEVHITIGHIICEIVEQDLIHENKI